MTGIPAAPRGVPKIEVTFNIDANGIVNVKAKDMGTGKEQAITITSSGGLKQDEIDRMVKEAEAHAAEDKAKKEEIEVKNNADSLVYQAEKAVKDFEGKADAATLEQVTKAKDALKAAIESGNVEDIKAKSEELTKPLYELSTKMYEQAQAAQQTAGDAQGAQGAQGGAQQNDDVVDAEYTEVKDDKKD